MKIKGEDQTMYRLFLPPHLDQKVQEISDMMGVSKRGLVIAAISKYLADLTIENEDD